MAKCKRCGSEESWKNGVVAGKQRYHCKTCGHNYREGDNRTNERTAAKKALCVLMYAMAKGSYRMIGRILGTDHVQIFRWIRDFGEALPEPEVTGDIREMEFDEMWHFVGSKKTNFGSSKPLTVIQGTPWPGCSAVVILQHSSGYTTK